MIGYVMIGISDLERARRFYDPLFAEMGQELCYCDEHGASWGSKADGAAPRFSVGYPFDGGVASAGNGAMTAFQIFDTEKIDRLHGLALQLGGSSEGAPGYRPHYGEGFYAAYLRDPDGNKIAFVSYR